MRGVVAVAALLVLLLPSVAADCLDGSFTTARSVRLGSQTTFIRQDLACIPSGAAVTDDMVATFWTPDGVWETRPAGAASAVRWDAGHQMLTIAPDRKATAALMAPGLLDAEDWTFAFDVRLGAPDAAKDPVGRGALQLRTWITSADMQHVREGTGLAIQFDNRGGDDYLVNGHGLVITDALPHTIHLVQRHGLLTVFLDDHELGGHAAIGGPDECIQLGIAGADLDVDQTVSVTALGAATNSTPPAIHIWQISVPDEFVVAQGAKRVCESGDEHCCLVNRVTDGLCVVECDADGWHVVGDNKAPVPAALDAVLQQFGCSYRAHVSWWLSETGDSGGGPGGAGGLGAMWHAASTDELARRIRATFTCSSLGSFILVDLRFDPAAFSRAGLRARDVRLTYWDGNQTFRFGPEEVLETANGRLSVLDFGSNGDSVWGIVHLTRDNGEDQVDATLATASASRGEIQANAYGMTGTPPAKQETPAPSVVLVLIAFAWLAVQRAKR